MTGYETLLIFGIPVMFGIAGALVYVVATRTSVDLDKKRNHPAH